MEDTTIKAGQFIRIGILGTLLFWVIYAGGAITPNFSRLSNFRGITHQLVPLLMIGVSTFLVMSSGGIDFSIGSLMGLTSVIAAVFNGSSGGVLAAVFAGLAFGGINGLLAVKTPVKAFLVTIATMSLARGIALRISGGTPKQLDINTNYFFIEVFLALLLVGLSFFLLFKEHGIFDKEKPNQPISGGKNVHILYYLLSSVSAVIAGTFLFFSLGTGMPMLGNSFEIDAIIIAILGGAVCGYAAANLLATALAALLLAVMVNLFNHTGMGAYTQTILKITVLFLGFIPLVIKGIMASRTGQAEKTKTGDAPDRGFAALGFFAPLAGLALYWLWKNKSPLKAQSCGKGALAGFAVIIIATIARITAAALRQ